MTSHDGPQSWRFLLSRRWVLFFLAVILLGYGCWWLGEWQFHRLENRKHENATIRANYEQSPVPVGDVLSPNHTVADDDEWKVVTATGTYDAADTIIVRYRSNDDGDPGVDVAVPLKTADGTSLLVDRGWLHTSSDVPAPSEVPAPPSGTVTVTGWIRQDWSGTSTTVSNHSVRALSGKVIGQALGLPMYDGFLQLKSEDPKPATALSPNDLPDLGNGPHFFYGLQWWFFGILAAGGFGYLAWDERHHGDRGERRRAAAAAMDAETERGRAAGRRTDA
ncbi:SURF1 family cytochrome oxidase biogenesis protein [Nocardioides montaniterrae]